MQVKLDNTDRHLLNIIQADFPLTREPFSALGQRLGIRGTEVIRRIGRLKTEGVIRLIGPVFDPGKLGYQTTLAAMQLSSQRLDEADRVIGCHPRVSHCYVRDHDFNLWFTLAIRTEEDMEKELRQLGAIVGAEHTLNLPAVQRFKIGVYFDVAGVHSSPPNAGVHSGAIGSQASRLPSPDRAIINELQKDILLTPQPFDLMSTRLSLDVAEFLGHCQTLLRRQVMRRFSASISHQSLGFVANAMACWRTPPATLETAARKMAMFPEVSHCYERKTSPAWPYNLYAMIHADTKWSCAATVDRIALETGLDNNGLALLFTTREVKKTRVEYPV